jgi:hypothetical protein
MPFSLAYETKKAQQQEGGYAGRQDNPESLSFVHERRFRIKKL